MKRLSPLLLSLVLSCAPKQAAEPTNTVSEVPSLRLPTSARPLAYNVELRIDPSKTEFEGTITIDLEIAEDIQRLWLHAEGLQPDSATLIHGDDSTAVALTMAKSDFVALERPFKAGTRATVEIRYRGAIDTVNTAGVFRQRDGDRWYVFTQFEATDARRAFPCFDEPSYKVPWQLTLEVPSDLIAVSNTPEIERTELEGWRRFSFAKTKPLPSYLIAFAVGAFDSVDAASTQNGTEINILVPRGRGDEAGWAVEATVPILEAIEKYIGSPYPYQKLDLVAVPETVGFAAMEHPGLITYGEQFILRKPTTMTEQERRLYAWFAVHEFAHQWFGNVVTAAWWDDIWLNESLASWAEEKIIAQWKPRWHAKAAGLADRAEAMDADSLASARKIRQPIMVPGDIGAAFDSITYEKGSRILWMFEAYIGVEDFRAGILHYLDKYRWKTATADDFLAALDQGSGRSIGYSISSFLTQVGTPEVSVALDCRGKTPALTLSQKRYRPLGSTVDTDQRWSFPVCFRYPRGTKGPDCVLLDKASATIELDGHCPMWVLPNPGGDGYYRWRTSGLELVSLAQAVAEQDALTKVAFADDLRSLVESGGGDLGLLLATLKRFGQDDERVVVEAALDLTDHLEGWISAEHRHGFARFVREAFSERARRLGWQVRRNESAADSLLRPRVLAAAGLAGDDPTIGRDAVPLARDWLAGIPNVPADLVDTVLAVAARHGDEAFLAAVFDAALTSTSRARQRRLLGALAYSKDPRVATRIMDAILDKNIDIRIGLRPLRNAAYGNRFLRDALWDAVTEHFDRLVDLLPRHYGTGLARFGAVLCDPARRTAVETFLRPRLMPMQGGKRSLAQSLESYDLCVAQRQHHLAALSEWLTP